MVVAAFDSYVFLELILRSSPGITRLFLDLKQGKISAVASSIALAEVKFHVGRKLGEAKAAEACFLIRSFQGLSIINVTPEIAETAASLRLKYYSPKSQLSFADCIHAATALSEECEFFATGDEDFLAITELKTKLIRD